MADPKGTPAVAAAAGNKPAAAPAAATPPKSTPVPAAAAAAAAPATAKNGDQIVRAGDLAEIPLNLIRENQVALRPVDKTNTDYICLVDSIRQRGVMSPITVREFPDPDPRNQGRMLYGIIDGLQRYNASLDAGRRMIPAHIMNMNQAEIEEAQIVANAVRIETKPIQYTRQLERLLVRNPLLTIPELASRLSRTPKWLYDRFNITKKLPEDVQKLVDDNKLKLSNAIQLAKLPEAEIPNWLDRAISMDVSEFMPAVAGRIKELKDARAQGRAPKAEQFVAIPKGRSFSELKNEYQNTVLGPQLLAANKVNDPLGAWKLAIAFAVSMDPVSQEEQKKAYEARQVAAKAEKDKKKAERDAAKNEEAARIAASLAPDTKFVEKTEQGAVVIK